jgi:hypothetical protein
VPYIFISAVSELTSFANNLGYLTRLPGPIRTVKSIEELLPPERAVNAPREIVRLVQWFMTNAKEVVSWRPSFASTSDTSHLPQEGLFTLPAEDDLVETIREVSGHHSLSATVNSTPLSAWILGTTFLSNHHTKDGLSSRLGVHSFSSWTH